MEPIIVSERSAEIRAIARNALRENWVKVVIAMGLYYILTTTVPYLLSDLIPGASYLYYNQIINQSVRISYVANLYDVVLSGALLYGLCSFMLAFFRHHDTHPGHLFNGFEHFIKAFCLMFIQGLFVALWALLFIIPGIIALIRYSQAFYILADNPQIGVMEALNASKRMMQGNKARYFCLNLSFIGWWILASLVSAWIPMQGVVGTVLDLVASIPSFFVLAYQDTAQAAFYELASGHLVAAYQEPKFHEEDYHF